MCKGNAYCAKTTHPNISLVDYIIKTNITYWHSYQYIDFDKQVMVTQGDITAVDILLEFDFRSDSILDFLRNIN